MPVRSCVCCRKESEKKALLRVVLSGAELMFDPLHLFQSRGAYVCLECFGRNDLLGRIESSLKRKPGSRKSDAKRTSGGMGELLSAALVQARNQKERAKIEELQTCLSSAAPVKSPVRGKLGFRK